MERVLKDFSMSFYKKVGFVILVLMSASFAHAGETDAKMLENGMWRDPVTGLIWMRCTLGQTWDGSTCIGEPRKFSWRTAHEAAKSFKYNGLSNWRIPHIYELSTIRVCKQGEMVGDLMESVVYNGHKKNIAQTCNERAKEGDMAINTLIFPNMPEYGSFISTTLSYGAVSVYTASFDAAFFGLSYIGSGENDGENCIDDDCNDYVLRLVQGRGLKKKK